MITLESGKEKRSFLLRMLLPVCLALFTILLFRPGYSIGVFSFEVAFFTAGTFAAFVAGLLLLDVPAVIRGIRRLDRFTVFCFCIIVALAIWHVFSHRANYSIDDAGLTCTYVILPLFGVAYRKVLLKVLPKFLFLLFWLNAMVCAVQVVFHRDFLIGIPGNINWNAALVVFTFPFAAYCLYRLLSNRMPKAAGAAVSIILTSLPVVFVLVRTSSRGAITALAAGAVFSVFTFCKKTRKPILLSALALSFVVSFLMFVYADKISDMMYGSERIAIYTSTVKMIASSPVTGYGPASFEAEYIPFRSQDYFFISVCAVRTNHPHNHLLFMAASFGIIGLLAWIIPLIRGIFLSVTAKSNEDDFVLRLLAVSFVMLLVHAQFDLILYTWPTAQLGLIASGIFFAYPARQCETKKALKRGAFSYFASKCCEIAGLILVVAAVGFAVLNFLSDYKAWTVTHHVCPESERGNVMLQAMAISDVDRERLYDAAMILYLEGRYEESLHLWEKYEKTCTPSYGRSDLYRGICLKELGRYQESLEYFFRDAEHYPMCILSIVCAGNALWKMGRVKDCELLGSHLENVMKLRGINENCIEYVKANPDCDLRPWNIPVELRGKDAPDVRIDGRWR